MRIPVEGIPAVGRRIPFGMREAWAVEAAAGSLDRAPEHLEGALALSIASRRAGLIQIEATIDARAPAACDRCGEACELRVREVSTLLYAPEESGGDAYDGGEIELSVQDLDLGWYRDGAIELADVVREAVALALPFRIVCTDTPECDRRTDALLTAQAAEPGHPGFQALKALKSRPDDIDGWEK